MVPERNNNNNGFIAKDGIIKDINFNINNEAKEMKNIIITIHAPHLPIGGQTKVFKSARLARVWAKGFVQIQPCGWSVCSVDGWRGSKPFRIPNPVSKRWQKGIAAVLK